MPYLILTCDILFLFCLNLFKDACKHIDLNLEYFTTRSLVKRAPEALIEIRKQIVQNPDFNINNGKLSWLCESPREWSSLKDYAIYQTKLYHEKNGKERMKKIYIIMIWFEFLLASNLRYIAFLSEFFIDL